MIDDMRTGKPLWARRRRRPSMHAKLSVVLLTSLAAGLTLASVAWACTPSGFGTPMSASPNSGPKGTVVTLTATAYPPQAPVHIDLSPNARPDELIRLGTTTTDDEGRLSATVTIPDVAPGAYTVMAGERGRAAFEVTPAPEPSPGPQPAAVVTPPPSAWTEPPPPAFDPGTALNSTVGGAVTSADTRRPRVTARSMANRRLAVVVRRGLAFTVGCSEACRIQARAVTDARTARRLGLRGAVARRSAAFARADRARIVMRLSPRARAKLRGLRVVRLKVTLTVTDRADNTTVVVRRVKLRR